MAVNQISVFLENRTGQLAEITGLLAENKINLRAISIAVLDGTTFSYNNNCVIRSIAFPYSPHLE